jgi:glycosyltransferase involved in cell wall biosynthesis
MTLGLIARADDTGLGIQTWEFARHMHPDRVMVIDISHLKRNTLHPDRFPGATIVHGFPDATDIEYFLDGLDVAFTAESTYGPLLLPTAERAGVRTVVQYNYEFLDERPEHGTAATVLAAPSSWHYDDVEHPGKIMLPVPIATSRFPKRETTDRARRFLHVIGRPAIHDRNGTADLVQALRFVRADIEVVFACQDRRYISDFTAEVNFPPNIKLTCLSEQANYWDLYRDIDALIMPRKFGGLCLPVQEALGAGIPVIMPDIAPNNTWLPKDWLVPATRTGEFKARRMIDLHMVDHIALAARIDLLAGDSDFYCGAVESAHQLADALSWDAMRPQYEQALAGRPARSAA